MQPAGIILAGGEARRMGGRDKPLLELAGKPLMGHIVERLSPQVSSLAISANGDPERFSRFALPVLPDDTPMGPLSGVLSGMDWAASLENPPRQIVTIAGDTPFVPRDLVLRFDIAAEGEAERIVLATSNGRRHPTICLWPVSLRHALRRWLAESESSKVLGFIHRHDFSLADFQTAEDADPFFNINTPEDLEAARIRAEDES
ncbi:molybdenum cofactor guanylyltransferase MobA [Notoacmeibacter ruber]|uniref:Molybdenum cofactor guanylyltransferase n=1 Tax=Notoacmeibacter ruber TaxID=2670375 RepID=A0A3L7JC88_9HYPH|nr:molybdenum cofactor guanylyltransferase MobA [Notoacmeibacter ruber]RLQ88100.1 molybdenum cofactor guanylyltransferase MobA [Notoacmeibacter ruber]